MSTIQTDWLTQTKFISPRLRDEIVPRQVLMLVAKFFDVCLAWISLDEGANSPARFLSVPIGDI